MNIGFFDSGIGGLAYLQDFRALALRNKKSHNLSYFADNAGFPYGVKEATYLEERVLAVTCEFIRHESLDILVLACNTASLHVVNSLRMLIESKFKSRKIEVVGVIPAIKPAIELISTINLPLNKSSIYVMNTRASSQYSYGHKLINEIKGHKYSNVKVYTRDCQDLVLAVEHMVSNEEKSFEATMIRELEKIIQEILKRKCQVAVLGCTHFLHIKSIMQELLPNIHIVDSLQGVTKRVESKVEELRAHVKPRELNSIVKFYISSNDTAQRFEYICKKFNMEFSGTVNN